jgi:hypothetical protein
MNKTIKNVTIYILILLYFIIAKAIFNYDTLSGIIGGIAVILIIGLDNGIHEKQICKVCKTKITDKSIKANGKIYCSLECYENDEVKADG